MKLNQKILISSAVASLLSVAAHANTAAKASDGKISPMGKCYGIVGKGQGECGGKDPATGKGWGCAGNNPTADLGWKKMTEDECNKTPKHADASEKKFVKS